MKKIISLLLAVIMLASALPIQAQDTTPIEYQVRVTYNGFEIPFDVQPRITESSTMVPFRAIFELLGAEVEWVPETREVVSAKDGDIIKLAIGSTELYKNGVVVYNMPVPAVIIEENGESRTLVPLRAVSESLGYFVDWDPTTRTAIILSTDIYESIPENLRMIGDFPVSEDVYYYFNTYSKAAFGEVEEGFFDIPENKQALDTLTEKNLYDFYSIMTLASASGMSIYQPIVKAAVDNAFAGYKQYYGESFTAILAADGMSENVFKLLLFATLIEETFAETVIQAFNTLSEDETIDILTNGEFPVYRAAHILFNDLEIANKVLPEAKEASDDEFFSLIKAYSKDTASDSNRDGYYFTENHLTANFEETVFALDVGETSDIVQTEHGYHIIRRLPVEKEYLLANIDSIVRSYAQSEYFGIIESVSDLLKTNNTNS